MLMSENTAVLTQHFTLGKLFKYVLPTILAVLLASLYTIVDGIFVSNFGGTAAFAALNQVGPIFMIVAAIGFMFGTGGSALVGKVLGEGDTERANGLFSFIAYVLIGIGVACSVILWFTMEPILKALGATEDMMQYCLAYSRILIPAIPLFMLQFYCQSFLATAKKPTLGLVFTVLAGVTNIVGDAILVGVLSKGDPIKAVQVRLRPVRRSSHSGSTGRGFPPRPFLRSSLPHFFLCHLRSRLLVILHSHFSVFYLSALVTFRVLC